MKGLARGGGGAARGRSEFVVFCEARTGSYNLVSLLNSAEDIVCHGEVFKKNRIEISDFHRKKLGPKGPLERNRDGLGFLKELRAVNPFRHFGFKLFATHLAWAPGATEYLVARSTRRVILFRPPLEIYASGMRARETGVWTNRAGREVAEKRLDTRVRFTPESFEAFTGHYNRYAAMCHMLAARPGSFVIHYEQTADPAVLDALLGFLGSKSRAADISSEYRKQYRGGLAEGFVNWDELEAEIGRLTPLTPGPAPTVPVPGPAAAPGVPGRAALGEVGV